MIDQHLINSKMTFFKHLGYVLAFVVGSTGLSTDNFFILGAMLSIDTITGIIRSGTIHGWHSVTSARATSGIVSKVLVMLVPLIIAWAGKGADINMLFVAKGALSVIILAEAYSTISNIYAIAKREDVAEFDAISWSLHFIRDTFEKYFKISYKNYDKDIQKK